MNEHKGDKHSTSSTNWNFQSAATYVVKTAKLQVLREGGATWKDTVEKLERVADHLEGTEIKPTHTTSDGQVLKAGVRVFYSGDMANLERPGTVTRIETDKWGTHVAVLLDAIEPAFDEEREPERVAVLPTAAFEPAPGRRFTTLQLRQEERDAKIAQMAKDYELTDWDVKNITRITENNAERRGMK